MALRTPLRNSARRRFAFPLLRLESRICPAADIGNTLATSFGALLTYGAGQFSTTDTIGDGAFSDRDVDLFRINAQPGLRITAVTSQPAGNGLFDTVLRLFDGNGVELAKNDDYTSIYSRLSFTVQTGLYFYLGVSGFGNAAYDPNAAGSGANGNKGDYQLSVDIRGNTAKWDSQGPDVIQNGQVEGMAAQNNPVNGAVQVAVPDPANVNRMWIGTANGGIWRTNNATAANPTWVALTDDQKSLSISDIDLDPTDPTRNTLVASIGKYSNLADIRELFVNGKRILDGGDLTGLLRTTDGGDTWTTLGGATLANHNISEVIVRGKYIIAAEEINDSPGVVYTGGLYFSEDTGQTFVEITANAGIIAEDGPVFDMAGDPGNPNRIYATLFDTATAKGKLYRTDDAGKTWMDKTGTLTFPALPRQVRLAVHDSGMGNAVYFAAADKVVTDIYRSIDQGATWAAIDRPEWGGFTLTAATNANPIKITSNEHNRSTGDIVVISGVMGNTNANGRQTITKVNANEYTLNGVMGNAAYTGGGLIQLAVTAATKTNPITITTGGKHFLTNGRRVQITGVGGTAEANGIFVANNVTATTFDLFLADGVTSVDGTGSVAYMANTGAMKILSAVSPGGQTRTNLTLAADPTDPNIVYVAGDRQSGLNEILSGAAYVADVFPNDVNAMTYSARIMRGKASLASGSQWEPITNQYADPNQLGPGTSPHADSRCIVFDKSGRLIETDDTGVYARSNPRNPTGVWTSTIGAGLRANEFHSLAYDAVGNVVMAGAQDAGTSEQPAAGNLTWNQSLRPDGVNYLKGDGNVVEIQDEGAGGVWRYGSFPNYGSMQRQQYDAMGKAVGAAQNVTLTLGAGKMPGGSFYTPYVASATTAQGLALSSGPDGFGNYHVYTSGNRGGTVTLVPDPAGSLQHIFSLAHGGKTGGAVEPNTPLYVGANNGIFLSQGGAAFAAVPNYPGGWVADLVLDSEEWRTVYLIDGSTNTVREIKNASAAAAGDHKDLKSLPRYNGGLDNAGKLRTISFHRGTNSNVVLVGSDRGVYAMQTSAPNVWTKVGTKLPNAPGMDLRYDKADNLLSLGTMGRGAWIYNNLSNDHDTANPTVVSINRAFPDPNNAALLNYTVTFSEHVFGVTKTAFETKTPDGKVVIGAMDVQSVTGSGSTYTISVAPGALVAGNATGQLRLDLFNFAGISDVAGNLLATKFMTGQSYTINPILPRAVAATTNVTLGGGVNYSFTVTYTDDIAVAFTTLKTGNVIVTGPNGFNVTPIFKGVNIANNGTPRIGTYEFTPPNAAWSSIANGTYTVTATAVVANQAKDAAGNGTPANPIGTFTVDIADSRVVDVTNNVDNGNYAKGDLSLREAIKLANMNVNFTDTITFDTSVFATPQTITLTGNRLDVTDSVVIRGTSAANVTIDANLLNEIFLLDGPGVLNIVLDQLTLTKGKLMGFSGGAIYNNGENVTISNSVITANQAFTGGAIVSVMASTLTLRNCAVTNNTALAGGGLDMDGGKLTIENSTFSGNSSTGVNGGGAILFRNTAAGGQVLLRNSTISGNTSANNGGGIRLYYFNGELLLQNCTIRNNSVTNAGNFGGGIYLTSPVGSITLRSSIVSGNTAPNHSNISSPFSTVTASFSAIGDNAGLPMFVDQGGNLAFGTPLNLGALANNGGFTQTHLPLAGSPVIDVGSNPAGLFLDQRGVGFPRESAPGKPDIGAAEFVASGLIQGRVFDDRDGDLFFGVGDVGLPGRVVFLDTDNNGKLNGAEPNVMTDANGIYQFTGQPNGATTVRTIVPVGWNLLAPAGGGHAVTLPPGAAGRDFPQARPNTVSGFVYEDKNRNGVAESGEPGIADVMVFLDENRNGTFEPGKISAANLPLVIPDLMTITSTLKISGFTGAVTDLNINLDISHSFDSDLIVSLKGPTGLTVVLFDSIGGFGVNFTDTTLDDQAVAGIGTGMAPFNGLYKPANPVNGFNGLDPNGTWTLIVQDKVAAVAGVLNSWQLQFNNGGEPGASTDANGRYVISKMLPGGYNLRHVLPTGFVTTTQPVGGIYFITLAAGDVKVGNNFGDAKIGPPPRISAIQRANTDPANGPLVAYTVTFSEPVTVPNAANFSVVTTGGVTGNIMGIAGGPTVYTVNVGGIAGTGTLRLDLANSNMLADVDMLPVINVPFVGETYAITNPTPPPKVLGVLPNNGAIQRSIVNNLTVNFTDPVFFPFGAAAAFQLTRIGPGSPVGPVSLVVSSSATSVTITFGSSTIPLDPGGSLIDGRYQLTIFANNVQSAGGPLDGNGDGTGGDNYVQVGDPTNGLFRFFGDADGDGAVAANDFIQFRLAFGGTGAVFDFNNDGSVAASDFIQFRLRFGGSI